MPMTPIGARIWVLMFDQISMGLCWGVIVLDCYLQQIPPRIGRICNSQPLTIPRSRRFASVNSFDVAVIPADDNGLCTRGVTQAR